MRYRRPDDDDDEVFSSRWRIAHRSELVEFGIPDDVAGNDRRWRYVLLHGDDVQSGWSESWLSDQQASTLLVLLKSNMQNASGVWLVQSLQRRCGESG